MKGFLVSAAFGAAAGGLWYGISHSLFVFLGTLLTTTAVGAIQRADVRSRAAAAVVVSLVYAVGNLYLK